LTSEAPANLSDVRIGGSRIALEPHNCFACGTLNVHGIGLQLHAGDDRCWTELALPERFQGWDDIVHGGIICTILDEVMAWALVDHDMWGVTARMSVEFKRPVPIGRLIRAEGRVLQVRRRIVEAEGVILEPGDGAILARAQGTFVGASEERKQELKARYGFRDVPGAAAPSAAPAAASAPGARSGMPDIVDPGS
jgi:uncharacterized protein (TIGR00369 family)